MVVLLVATNPSGGGVHALSAKRIDQIGAVGVQSTNPNRQ
jgi:hypothetical protein